MRLSREKTAYGLLFAYALILLWLSRDISGEFGDGLAAVKNALALAGIHRDGIALAPTRPPLGCALLAPAAGLGYLWGGPVGAIQACHVAMCALTALLVGVCWRVGAKMFSPVPAACATLALAASPLIVRYAPFALFDILSALAVIPFLWASWRCIRQPSRATCAWALAAYILAVLTRFQLCVMILAPLSYILLLPDRWQRLRAAPLWLGPALAYPMLILALALCQWRISGHGLLDGAQGVHRIIVENVVFGNMAEHKSMPWSTYLFSLWRQLGPGGCAAVLWGLWFWASGREGLGHYLALTLGVYFFFMSFLVATKEDRYLISILPLVYAAAAQGLESLLSGLPKTALARALAAAAFAALLPWIEIRDSWLFLAREPSVRSSMPWDLAKLLAAGTPAGGCVRWDGGYLTLFSRLPVLDRNQQMPLYDPQSLYFLADGKTYVPHRSDADDCRVAFTVEVPEMDNRGTPPLGLGVGVLASIQEHAAPRRRWEVFEDGVRPAAPD